MSNHEDSPQVDVKMAQLKGSFDLLQLKLETGMEHVGGQLGTIQAQLQEMTRLTTELARHQATVEAQGNGLQRCFETIERHTTEFAEWRKEHEADNRRVADRVVNFGGMLVGFLAVAGVASGSLAALANKYVDEASNDRKAIREELQRANLGFDARLDGLEAARKR